MRFLTMLVAATALISGLDASHAHPGHIAEDGHGHSHWAALFILGGLGALAAGGLLFRMIKGRLPFIDARAADK